MYYNTPEKKNHVSKKINNILHARKLVILTLGETIPCVDTPNFILTILLHDVGSPEDYAFTTPERSIFGGEKMMLLSESIIKVGVLLVLRKSLYHEVIYRLICLYLLRREA